MTQVCGEQSESMSEHSCHVKTIRNNDWQTYAGKNDNSNKKDGVHFQDFDFFCSLGNDPSKLDDEEESAGPPFIGPPHQPSLCSNVVENMKL